MTGVEGDFFTLERVLFLLFAIGTVTATLGVIVARNPINSAMSLVASFFFLAGIYVLLWAHTIAVLQILVYAGAIMVLFLFVIMLLSLTETALGTERFTVGRIIGGVAAAGLLFVLWMAITRSQPAVATFDLAQQRTFGTLAQMGKVVYGTYLLPFEAVSLLLLVAIVGAVVVAKSKI